jgi:hypothetical protein
MVAKRTVARTIRLDPEIDNILKQEAQQLGLTHTSVATMALRKYANFDRFADKIGSVTIPRETLNRIFNFLSHEEAELVGSLANFAGKNSRQYMNLLFGHATLADFISLLQMLDDYAHLFEFDHREESGKQHFIFAHNMGSKWSSFLEGAIKATLREVFSIRGKFERTDTFLSCTFEASL